MFESVCFRVDLWLILFAGLLAANCSTGARNDSENLILAHDQQLFTVDLDFGTAVLAKQDPVALLNI